jgi:hypothetical protein
MSSHWKISATLVFASISKKGGDVMKSKKCPVCDWEIQDVGTKVRLGGTEITVCCDDCAKKAKENPAKYFRATK